MPIGDLLAQISGGESSAQPSVTPSLQRANTLPKRRADEDLRNNVSKTPRVSGLSSTVGPRPTDAPPRPRQGDGPAPISRPSQPSRPLDRPNPQRPVNGNGSKPSVLSSKPMNGTNRVTKPLPNRPSPGPQAAPAAPKGPLKKGSYAEVMARAQRSQAQWGSIGKIQHKKVEKAPVAKKVKDEPKPDPRDPKKRAPSGYTGTSKPGMRPGAAPPSNGTGANANPRSKDGRNGVPDRAKGDRAKAAAEVEREKKFKKSAAATTGYTGTARSVPAPAAAKKRDGPRGGALVNPAPRRRQPKSSRYEDDYDEDMDDFIDYDDEEDQQGPRYGYASDESSDMEAGLDDIDVEERRAEKIARQEDIEEERREREHKASKEARKRRAALEALRASRR